MDGWLSGKNIQQILILLVKFTIVKPALDSVLLNLGCRISTYAICDNPLTQLFFSKLG